MKSVSLFQELYSGLTEYGFPKAKLCKLCSAILEEPVESLPWFTSGLPAEIKMIANGQFVEDTFVDLTDALEKCSDLAVWAFNTGEMWEVWSASISEGSTVPASVESKVLADFIVAHLRGKKPVVSVLNDVIKPILAEPAGRTVGEFAEALSALEAILDVLSGGKLDALAALAAKNAQPM